jgi:hypothetical protein
MISFWKKYYIKNTFTFDKNVCVHRVKEGAKIEKIKRKCLELFCQRCRRPYLFFCSPNNQKFFCVVWRLGAFFSFFLLNRFWRYSKAPISGVVIINIFKSQRCFFVACLIKWEGCLHTNLSTLWNGPSYSARHG